MGTNYYAVRNKASLERPIHIGKSSIGWKFLFRDQDDTWSDPPVVWHTFDQVKDWLTKYTVLTNEYVILDEYDEPISFDDFVKLVERKQRECKDNPDNFRYCKNVDGYRFDDHEFC